MEGILLLVAGVVVVVGGIRSILAGSRKLTALEKYEFENRTDGGVVQFEDFQHSRRHPVRKARAKMWVVFGLALIIVGAVVILYGLADLGF